MNISVLGNQICKFRKEKGLTQEELGKAVGVSTQAVSRWECGGTPDVALLPAIADTLSVGIDALFGRDGGAFDTGEARYKNHLASMSHKQRLDSLVKFLYSVELTHESEDLSNVFSGFPARAKGHFTQEQWFDVIYMSDDGFTCGVCADDCSFMTIFPEPEEGYAHYLSSNGFYRRLFAALAKPNVLEVLLDLASEGFKFLMPVEVARRNNISVAEATEALETLAEVDVLERVPLEQGNGTEYAYSFSIELPIVPMLIFSSMVGQRTPMHFTMINHRKNPILRKRNSAKA